MKQSKTFLQKAKYITVSAVMVASGISMFGVAPKASAACTPATDYGTVTLSMSVPSATTYRVWSRIMAPDTTNNSYSLEIDGGSCIVVGNNASTPANTWTWVDYSGGNTATKINSTLSAGTHTFKLIGTEPSVAVDRLILTSDTACVPSGTGDNCANPSDTTPPTVSLSAPANGATVSGSAVTISATAADDVGVARVEFYIAGQLAASDATSSYGILWNTTAVVNGSYQITAKAFDAAGNSTTSAARSVTVNNVTADTTKPTISITAPVAGTVAGNVTFSATASDNIAVSKVDFSVDGSLKNSDTTSPYSTTINTTTLSNASHTFTATAYDAAGNSQPASVAVTVNNGSGGTSGDVTGDGHVTIQDLAVLVNNYGKASGAILSQGDLNADGKITIQDLAILIAHYGQ